MSFTEYAQIEQGSDEWYEQRRGLVTASIMDTLITRRKLTAIDYACPNCEAPVLNPCRSARTGEPIKTLHSERAAAAKAGSSTPILEPASNDTSRDVTRRIVAERITGNTDPTFISDDMWRGMEDEPKARDLYHEHYAPVRQTGFMLRDDIAPIGYSPDGVVGKDGLIEIKSRRQKNQLNTILSDVVPMENMAQLQTGLYVSGRDWVDFISYCGGMHLWVKRVFPIPAWQDVIVRTARAFEQNAAEMIRVHAELTEGLLLTERTIEQEIQV